MPHTNSRHRREHAVVIGASMGGLAAAAAVAPHFDRVTVLDRDALPAQPGHRRGVPQSKHAHGFQPGGLRALDELLPGLTDQLLAGGAPQGDVSERCGWFIGGGTLARATAGLPGMGLTRPFVEHAVRTRVSSLPNVTVRAGAEVAEPLRGPGRSVIGVELLPERDNEPERIEADLVIDCSGRGSRLPQWLAELGMPAPAEERVHCKMAYLSRRWRFTSDAMGADIVQVITPAQTPHFGVCIAQEDGSYIVTLGGLLGGAPAKNDESYHAFARALPNTRIAEALKGAEPLTPYQTSHFAYSRRRRFDKLGKHPDGLIALGDAIASFNPMYGQGMTVAALEALALRDLLQRGDLDPKTFYRRAHRLEDVAWKISASGDLRFDAVAGRRTPDMKLMNSYLDRLTLAARQDPVLAHQFLRVAGFIDPPTAFFKPSIVWRVLRARRATANTAAVQSAESGSLPTAA